MSRPQRGSQSHGHESTWRLPRGPLQGPTCRCEYVDVGIGALDNNNGLLMSSGCKILTCSAYKSRNRSSQKLHRRESGFQDVEVFPGVEPDSTDEGLHGVVKRSGARRLATLGRIDDYVVAKTNAKSVHVVVCVRRETLQRVVGCV